MYVAGLLWRWELVNVPSTALSCPPEGVHHVCNDDPAKHEYLWEYVLLQVCGGEGEYITCGAAEHECVGVLQVLCWLIWGVHLLHSDGTDKGMYVLQVSHCVWKPASHPLMDISAWLFQVCGGVRRRGVHHLHSHGTEEQELRLSPGICLEQRLLRLCHPRGLQHCQDLQELQGTEVLQAWLWCWR